MGTETMKGSNYAWAIAVACVAFYAIPLGVVANQAGLFASPVMEEFGWSRTDATLYMSIQPWVAAICTPFAGKLISRFNPRWVMTAAAAVFGLASLACAWFTEPWQWNVYGVLYGASAAFWMYIATPTFINRWFAKSNGTVIGVIGVCASLLGAFMSPVIQGWISGYGWHTARIIISVIALVASVVLTAALLRESPEKMGVLPWGYGAAEVASAKSEAKSVIDVIFVFVVLIFIVFIFVVFVFVILVFIVFIFVIRVLDLIQLFICDDKSIRISKRRDHDKIPVRIYQGSLQILDQFISIRISSFGVFLGTFLYDLFKTVWNIRNQLRRRCNLLLKMLDRYRYCRITVERHLSGYHFI